MAGPVSHAQQIADAATVTTYASTGFLAGILTFADQHAQGLMALAALGTFAVTLIAGCLNWYYRRKAHRWDGRDRRRS